MKLAGTAAATSITAASYSWLSTATDLATFGAAVVSIVVGTGAAWFYYERARKLRNERKNLGEEESESVRDSGPKTPKSLR